MLMRTIRCKLKCSIETALVFLETKHAFGKACNLVLQEALKAKTKDPIQLHKLTYAAIRKKYLLSANLAVRAIRRVASALSRKQKCPSPKQFRSASIEYDARIFTFWEEGFKVSLTTLSGRVKASLDIGEYQKRALQGKKPTSATLVQKGKEWHLNIAIEEEEPPLKEGGAIGIDLGLRYTAYTSQVCFHSKQKGVRVKDVFSCTTCGERHADFNAACMISIGGAVVNQPELRV